MARTTFSGPVKSDAGFIFPVTVTASLPAATSVAVGTTYVITDNGAGDDEVTIVINNGTAWVTAVGAALS
jgi:hypothetical protein